MYRSHVKLVLTVISVLLIFFNQALLGAKSANESKRIINKAAIRMVDYAFPDEQLGTVTDNPTERISLDRSKTSDAVGHLVGSSYYEWQHNGSMHRQIAVGSSEFCPWTMHVAYMYLPTGVLENREIETYGFDGASNPGTWAYWGFCGYGCPYQGYVSIDVTKEGDYTGNRLIYTNHSKWNYGDRNRIEYKFQFECNLSFYGASDRVPDSLNDCGTMYPTTPDEADVIWPDIAYQDPPDGPPVLHLIGSAFGSGSGASNFNYFQKINPEGVGDDPEGGTWTFGCAIDTIFNGEGYDLCASNDGTVAITWVALLPNEPGCDTCSQNSSTGDGGRDRWDNDLYVQINRNYGRGELGQVYDGVSNFWENRLNITKNSGNDWRPYPDISAMISTDQVFHVAYVAMEWDDLDPGSYRSRVFHWSEDMGFYFDGQGRVRTVSAAQWDPENCNPGAFNQNQAKLSIAECENNFYVMWVEMNSPWTTGNMNHDDCAQRAFDGDIAGAANGDLFISVSDDGGMTWDAPRPLTDTYGGPTGTGSGLGCDPAGVEGDCPSEHWPTMVEHGSDFPVNPPLGEPVDWNQSTALVGSHYNNSYLDIAYFHDKDPGGAVMSQGTWTDNDYLWMRIPCVSPSNYNPCSLNGWGGYGIFPSGFLYPNCLKHCENYQENYLLENITNDDITYTYEVIEEDPSAYPGWLQASGGDGVISAGMNNKDTIVISINDGGIVCSPGTIVRLEGQVIFTINEIEDCIGVYKISAIIADTCVLPFWDTVSTSCTDLIVGTNGNAGNAGSPGGVHMDYSSEFPNEPDSTADTYLYDCGDICGWMTPEGAVMNWGMFQATISDSVSFMPQYDGIHLPGSSPAPYGLTADHFYTGIYTTNDSSIAFEANWYAPTDAEYSCGFVIKHTKVYSFDGLPHDGITVGIAADWDIPSDSGSSDNGHGFGPGDNLVWQSGLEYDNDDPWDNSERFGGILYLGGYNFSSQPFTPGEHPDECWLTPHGMYTNSNSRLVYPYDLGFNSDTLYFIHSLAGENLSDSIEQDMFSGMTYVYNYDLAEDDTLHFFVALLSNVNNTYPQSFNQIALDAQNYFNSYLPLEISCCDVPGDINGDGVVGIGDITFYVCYMFEQWCEPNPCLDEMDVNNDCSIGISDLVYLVDYLFGNGPAPDCGCVTDGCN